jgi:penicillin-binding protein 1A
MIFRRPRTEATEPEDEAFAEFAGYGGYDPAVPAPAAAPKRRPWWPKIVAAILLVLIGLVAWLTVTAPLGKALEPLETPALLLTASDGTPIARRGGFKGAPVDVTKLPKYVGDAFVAIEDRRFYNHWGIDPVGIVRALAANARAGRVVQGGSTLTQQLAKTSFLTLDRSIKRKLQEVVIAVWLEVWLTKEEILSRYLSSVYFGDGAYGLRAAAMQYFSKDPRDLTLGEAAMLAGLVKAPSRLDPTKNYKAARARGKLVIAAMREQGLLTPEQVASARKAEMHPGRKGLPYGTYFADWVWPAAAKQAGDAYGEVKVETTLDARLQKLAERTVNRWLARSKGLHVGQAALVAMRPDGRVVAMVGGRDYGTSEFNRAVQAERQPGSAFKLFVYLAALRDGMTLDTRIEDRPMTIGDWSPENYGREYRGDISLRTAFALSSNVAAARIAEEVGVGAIKKAAKDLGVDAEIGNDYTIALGTSTMSLLDLTAAYAAVAGGIRPVVPYGVETRDTGWRGRFSGAAARARGFPEQEELRALLRHAVEHGTGMSARLPIPAYGKTGTTQDSRDALFVGFAGEGTEEGPLVVGVWVGNDDNSPMRGVTGSSLPAQIWRDFMLDAIPEARELARQQEAERRAREEAEREREMAIASINLSGLLGPEFAALANGGEIDIEDATRMVERLGRILDNAPENAETLRQAAEEWRDKLNDAIEVYEEREDDPGGNWRRR